MIPIFKNSYYNSRTSNMHIWEQINGEDFHKEEYWAPFVFVRSEEGEVFSLGGEKVEKKYFKNYYEYKDFTEGNYNCFENKVRPEIQYLSDKYHGIPDDQIEVPKLKMYFLDIEVISSIGFPKAEEASDPICLISITDNKGESVTFGTKEYTGQMKVKYHYCKTEKDLLIKFLTFMNRNAPDVLSGWNIWSFDLPYIINRSKNLLGEDSAYHNMLSPINVVRTWHSQKGEYNLDIAGVAVLDYLDLYKWYTTNNLESYTLDFVTKFELEKGKLDYSEYKDLRELYQKNWDKYVDYNITDAHRVYELEKKLGYIKLVQSLSLLTKAPMRYYNAMTQLIEGALLTYYRRNNLCAPTFIGGVQVGFEAAYVKEPQKGKFSWVSSLDIVSSYPSHIITLNMSVETYFGRILGVTEDDMVRYTRNRAFPSFDLQREGGTKNMNGKPLETFNKLLEKGSICVSPCGSIFLNKKRGVIADVERQIFQKRKEVKKEMNELKSSLSDLKGEEKERAKEKTSRLYDYQWALKIVLNAMFGILSVPYSRYFNTSIAEAITSCGRHTVKSGEKFVNQYLSEKYGSPKDFVIYGDTDSLYLNLGEYCSLKVNNWTNLSDDEKVKILLDISAEIESHVNERVFQEVQLGDYNSQIRDFKIKFSKENIAKRALFVKKKKYSYWCVNEDGIKTDKLKTTGLDIVRSDSCEAIRDRLKVVMEMIIKDNPDSEIKKVISAYKKELKSSLPEEIAANIGVHNIEKYVSGFTYKKGTPWHVKGVANYRRLLKELLIDKKYEDVYNGPKAKVVYVKPNKYKIETITFHRWPLEFNTILEVDHETMIEKFFLEKIKMLLEPMNKEGMLANLEGTNMSFF